MRRLLYIITISVAPTACSSESNEPDERPGSNGDIDKAPPPDYSAILASKDLRFESDTLKLDFEDGGILYSQEGETYKFVDLSNGVNIAFNPSKPSLYINGIDAGIDESRMIGEDSGVRWYVVLPDTAYIVVENR